MNVSSQGEADSNKWFWLGSAALRSKIHCCQSAWQKISARRIHWDCKSEVGAALIYTHIYVCVSLSISIAYLAAIWPAKQYHESEKSDNENVLSMATMKGAGGRIASRGGTGVTIDACAKACQVLAVSLSRTLPPSPLIFPSLSLLFRLSFYLFAINRRQATLECRLCVSFSFAYRPKATTNHTAQGAQGREVP